MIIKDLVAIQSDENRKIVFKHFSGEEGVDDLAISISDHSDSGGLFHFDSPHEAIAFAKRVIEAAEMHLP